MAQVREIKKRIRSVQNTQKVTHAMELVAAAKMRKAQILALAGRPYSSSLHEILSSVQNATKIDTIHPLLEANNSQYQLIIIVSSDRGLTGGLNLNVFREILRSEPKNAKYLSIGKKARDFTVKTGSELIASWQSEEIPFINMARTLTKMATESFMKHQFSKISMIYPHFDSTIKQTPRWVQILPIPPEENIEERLDNIEFLYEPTADQILNSILTHHILTQIYQVLIETKASEHSARMVAMKNATDAANDLIDDLTLTYNQARQESITKELLDITTAQRAFQ